MKTNRNNETLIGVNEALLKLSTALKHWNNQPIDNARNRIIEAELVLKLVKRNIEADM